jgi:hypothetical protein
MNNFVKSNIGVNIAVIMIALVVSLLLAPSSRVEASFSPTLSSQNLSSEDLDQLKLILEYKKVYRIFADLGYDDKEIMSRMSGLNSEEIGLLAGKLQNSMVPSGDGSVILVVALSALILAMLGIWILHWYKNYKTYKDIED